MEYMQKEPEFITGDWQVRVEVYDTYVIKYPKSLAEIREQIRKAQWTKFLSDEEVIRMAEESLRKHVTSVELLFDSGAPLALFANPMCQADGSIRQNRVLMLHEILEQEKSNSQHLLQSCIEAYTELWKYGLWETSWNFTLNNGIDANGSVVFVDVGECSDDCSILEKMLKEQRWKKAWSVKHGLTPDLAKQYIRDAEAILTIENLQKLWKESRS